MVAWYHVCPSPPPAATRSNDLANDRKLVAAILEKDRKATAEFVAKYADQIYLYIRSRLIPRLDLVDDLVQDVFLAAWENLTSYRGDATLGSWLQGIARHKVENYYRASLRAALPLEEAGAEAAEATMDVDLEEFVDRERLQQKTQSILATLPEAYSLVLIWRYWEQCSAQQMAIRTGKSEKAIERLLARAREMFREKWKRMARS
jgi:RNA polymerase sigma-70 factor (ECF subfamily)